MSRLGGNTQVQEDQESWPAEILFHIARQAAPEKINFEKPLEQMTRHLKPLFIGMHMNGCPVTRVLVDNGVAVNILPVTMLPYLGKGLEDLTRTDVSVMSFFEGNSQASGILPITLKVGSKEVLSAFFVLDTATSYNAILGRDWIHSNWCVPSSLYQLLIFWHEHKVEIVWADQRPFTVGSNVAEAYVYGEQFRTLTFTHCDKWG